MRLFYILFFNYFSSLPTIDDYIEYNFIANNQSQFNLDEKYYLEDIEELFNTEVEKKLKF